MANNLNIVQIENKQLGKHLLILSNDQLKDIGKTGAKAIEAKVINNQSQTTSSGRITISPDSQKNNEGGFIGNTTNWSQFFPNEENEKIPELIKKAKKWEDNLEFTFTTLAAFIGAGLGAYAIGGNIGGFTNISVLEILGPFTSKYINNNSEINESLKNLFEDFKLK